jgi:hypothetical protein
MKKRLHLTHGRNNLWLLGMILVSTMLPVRGWAIKNVWIDVPMNTRDGMQTMGVVVDTTLQFTAVTWWTPTNLSWTWSSGTTPTGSAWPYGYAQRAFPNAGTFDITAAYNGEVSYAQRVIAVDATVTVSTNRIPIYGGSSPIQGSATITLSTSPLPAGMAAIPVTIGIITGTGSATFDDGSINRGITQTSTLAIRGTGNSSVKGNLKVSCCHGYAPFSVRTWPKNFRQFGSPYAVGKILYFDYVWDSESGAQGLADLQEIHMAEYVTYNTTWHIPPYDSAFPQGLLDVGLAAIGGFDDRHRHPPFRKPYEADSILASQTYCFTDPLYNNGVYYDFPANSYHTIDREIYWDNQSNNWIYLISKDNFTAQCVLPP